MNLNFSNQLEVENSFLGETLLHGHWNQQQKKMVFVGFGNVIKHTPRCSSRSPPLSRQALAADQSGPPKSPAATNLQLFSFFTRLTHIVCRPFLVLNSFVQQDIMLSPMHAAFLLWAMTTFFSY